MKASTIPVRALNDYRRASPLTYLGLRHLLESHAGQVDRWAQEIATDIVVRNNQSSHLPSRLFKELKGKALDFRVVGYPSPCEALAEAALLAHCADAGGPFSPQADVFSYHLNPSNSPDGTFKRFFPLFGARHRAIGKACQRWPGDLVVYADLRQFYPSVDRRVSLAAWDRACEEAKLHRRWRELGARFLLNQKSAGKGLLVGPLFSHVVANLVLQRFDEAMRREFRGRYFRYVDDLALVIPKTSKDEALKFIAERAGRVGLGLNPKKHHELPAAEWRREAPYQADAYYGDDPTADSWWMAFIDQVKCFLMVNPGRRADLLRAYRNEHIRIPLPRYQADVQEKGYSARFSRRLGHKRFRNRVANLTVYSLVSEAKAARAVYKQEFRETWAQFEVASGLKRKWLVSRLKYLASRLVLLALPENLVEVRDLLGKHADFAEHHAVAHAVTTADVSYLLGFGGKACAAAAQAIASSGRSVRCQPRKWSDEAVEGYAMLILLGVRLRDDAPKRPSRDPRVRYVMGEFEGDAWAGVKLRFFAEVFCMRGSTSLEKQRDLFVGPFDPDENWVVLADHLDNTPS